MKDHQSHNKSKKLKVFFIQIRDKCKNIGNTEKHKIEVSMVKKKNTNILIPK